MITGGVGTGKTCLLTRYGKLSYDSGRDVIANYHLKKMKYDKLDMVDLYFNEPDRKNLILLGDELYTFMDCRSSMSKRNKIESYLIAQTRKKSYDLYFTTQFADFIDFRLMKFVDIWIEMSNIWLLNKTTGEKKKHPYKFICEFTDYRIPNDITQTVKVFDGRNTFDEYDTDERIYPPDDFMETYKKLTKKKSKNKKE